MVDWFSSLSMLAIRAADLRAHSARDARYFGYIQKLTSRKLIDCATRQVG